jgi:hypothetical protein
MPVTFPLQRWNQSTNFFLTITRSSSKMILVELVDHIYSMREYLSRRTKFTGNQRIVLSAVQSTRTSSSVEVFVAGIGNTRNSFDQKYSDI